ncbi:MAG: AGE family epimerase/isomerase [Spirosomataceae bacterium]
MIFSMQETVIQYRNEVEQELDNILRFWAKHALDHERGGFVAQMDYQNTIEPSTDKGLVLNARILWTFSAVTNFLNNQPTLRLSIDNQEVLSIAHRAYTYLKRYFRDCTHGGVYWSVTPTGAPSNTRKQIYGLAFTLYGVSEYYIAIHDQEALNWAFELFELIETYSFDSELGGYWEAFTVDWQPLEDLRLSEKDRNDPKTMNTHLHVIEAYANLYQIAPNQRLKLQIERLLEVFSTYIIEPHLGNLKLFFDKKWKSQTRAISFGHDIEAAWLLQESAEIINEPKWVGLYRQIALTIAESTNKALQPDGSLFHEYDPDTEHADKHREWWVSAEGMVGFLNAYQLSSRTEFFQNSLNLWRFAQQHLIDHRHGEWFWGVYEDMTPMTENDKIGFWKCPYHTVRACLEVIKRLNELEKNP